MHHSIQDVRTYFQAEFASANDFIIHTLTWNQKPIDIVYVATLVSEEMIQDGVLTPLNHTKQGQFLQTIGLGQMQVTCLLEQAVDALLRGFCVIYFDDDSDLYLFHTPSSFQLAFFTIQTAIGEGALTLPYSLHTVSAGDGWISLILAGITSQIVIVLIWQICRKYPELTLIEILPKLVGKPIGMVISLLFVAYFTALASIVLLNYTKIISSWVFPTTPRWIIMTIMMFTTYYLAKESLLMIARFEVLMSSILVILMGLILFPLFKGNALYLLPIGISGSWDIIKGVENAAIAMAGFELMFVVYPLIQSGERTILKTMMLSYSIVTLFYLLIVIACFIFFSSDELDIVPEPVLYMLKAVSFRFFERTDLIFLSFWITIVMTSIANYVFFAAASIQKLLKVKQPSLVTLIVVIICWLLVVLPSDFLLIERLNAWFSRVTLIMIYGLPILLFAISAWKHRKMKTVVE